MTTLLESVTAVLKSENDRYEKTANADWAAYSAILHRHDNLNGGDAKKVAGLMATLGITPADLELHILVVREAKRLRKVRKTLTRLEQELTARDHEVAQSTQRFEEAVLAQGKAYDALEQTRAMVNGHRVEVGALATLEQQFSGLLTGQHAEVPAEVMRLGTTAAVNHAKARFQRLGEAD